MCTPTGTRPHSCDSTPSRRLLLLRLLLGPLANPPDWANQAGRQFGTGLVEDGGGRVQDRGRAASAVMMTNGFSG